MVKLKTNKSVLSRLKITGGNRLLRKPANQSHFNAKDSGKKGRLKHRGVEIKKADKKSFRQFLPYHK